MRKSHGLANHVWDKFVFPFFIVFILISFTTGCERSKTPATPEIPKKSDPEPTKPISNIAKLDLNDVSILFPPPKTENDLNRVISINDISDKNGNPVWTDQAFSSFVDIANSDASKVVGSSSKISFDDAFKQKAAWHVAGIRVDPSAPGTSDDIRKNFGTSPQIRLILQPVTKTGDGKVKVHDFAAHMIYGYHAGVEKPPEGCGVFFPTADVEAFKNILVDISALKSNLAAGKLGGANVSTDNLPLGVHPGLKNETTATAFRDEIKTFLGKHLQDNKLFAMAVMGLDEPEPWIFVAMSRNPQTGRFSPANSPTLLPAQGKLQVAQMLSFRQDNNVDPVSANNNQNLITCRFDQPRKGLSTAELFREDPKPSNAKIREVVDLIADPVRSHFFNTDCVSCHTETHREIELLGTKTFKDVDPDVLPQEQWNVRNFGWFPAFFGDDGGDVQATVVRRTAAETRDVVNFINNKFVSQ